METLPGETLPERIRSAILGTALCLCPWWAVFSLALAWSGADMDIPTLLLSGFVLACVIGTLINLFIITPLILRFG